MVQLPNVSNISERASVIDTGSLESYVEDFSPELQNYFRRLVKEHELDPKEIPTLHKIGMRGQRNCYDVEIKAALKVSKLGASLDAVEQISARYPGALNSLHHCFGSQTVEREAQFSSYLERIYKHFEEPRCLVFYEIPQERFKKYPNEITELYEHHGRCTPELFERFGDSVIEKEREFRDVLTTISVASNYCLRVFKSLDVEALERFPEEITSIAKAVGKKMDVMLAWLSVSRLESHSDTIVQIAKRLR